MMRMMDFGGNLCTSSDVALELVKAFGHHAALIIADEATKQDGFSPEWSEVAELIETQGFWIE